MYDVTVEQAAHRLDVTEETIRRWIRADKLEARKSFDPIRNRWSWFLSTDDLDALPIGAVTD